jgi:AmmeMemoRadiSam system protein B
MSERPRLRPLEAFPIVEDGQRYLGLRDPTGLTEAVARLPPPAVAVVQLCDGEHTRDQICEEFERRHGSRMPRVVLDRLLEQLDQGLFLDSEHFRQHQQQVFEAFDRAKVRSAHLAGRSYPEEVETLRKMLDGFFHHPDGPGRPEPPHAARGATPRAIIAPHIDFHRGGPAYAWAYRPLAEAAEAPELAIVFGTDHNGAEHPFTLTRKHYDTPFGPLDTDVELVDALERSVREKLGASAAGRLFADERHHRAEHSIEFQMVWLRYTLGARAGGLRVLPILCGSLHHLVESRRAPASDPLVHVFLEALTRLVSGRRTLFVAGADLAHVGPRFGDPEPLSKTDRLTLESKDHASLHHCMRGDAEGWFAEIAGERDRRRVCGLPPIYALLKTAGLPSVASGRLAYYGQCDADEEGGSLVSITSVIYGA